MQEIVRFSDHAHKMIVGCLLGGNSMKSGMHILREVTDSALEGVEYPRMDAQGFVFWSVS